MSEPPSPPLFSASTTSIRQLFTLLKCVGFDSKAHLQLSSEGIRVTVEDTRVMQAHVFIYSTLFTPYTFHPPSTPPTPDGTSQEDPTVTVTLSLPSLLNTLSLFPLAPSDPSSTTSAKFQSTTSFNQNPVFSSTILRAPPTLQLSYPEPNAPLTLTLTDASLTTTAELNTYTPSDPPDIPLGELALRIILPAALLHDAISELADSSPSSNVLTLSTTPRAVAFSVRGDTGETSVSVDAGAMESWSWEGADTGNTRRDPGVGEKKGREWRYGFRLIKRALPAMQVASKVSLRVDREGVGSWQFMVELGEGGDGNGGGKGEQGRGFVDFRVLPLVGDEGDVGVDGEWRPGGDDEEEGEED